MGAAATSFAPGDWPRRVDVAARSDERPIHGTRYMTQGTRGCEKRSLAVEGERRNEALGGPSGIAAQANNIRVGGSVTKNDRMC